MEAFGVKVLELVCNIANVAPTILVKAGEGAVIIGKAVSTVLCGA
jgi:hypothetical protein